MKMDRRQFLELAGLAGLVAVAPSVAFAAPSQRVVLFVELNGGNDGLNTVVPYKDPQYRRLRPSLALHPDKLLSIDPTTGLHPSLTQTSAMWERGEVAIIEGLGYASPNRSHFRSIEIWETGTDSDKYSHDGWVARAVPASRVANMNPAGLIVGGGGEGPLIGSRTLELDEPKRLFKMARRLKPTEVAGVSNPALAHVLRTQNDVLAGVDKIRQHATAGSRFKEHFGGKRQLRPMELAAELIASGLPLMAVKVRVPGFDTHVNQARPHARLLQVVDEGIAAFRGAMKSAGMWDDVLVVTYSEFGRRPRENGGAGTDHGTAAPHLVFGGKVRGGRYGQRPSLTDLDTDGDLKHTTDYRRLYATVAQNWWGTNGGDFARFKPFKLV